MTKIKDTYSTWPQFSIGTQLAPPAMKQDVLDAHEELVEDNWDKHAHSIWASGYEKLSESFHTVTNAIDMSVGSWRVQPVWGKIDEETFWYLLSRSCFPMNQQFRHLKELEYCVLRDYVHDRCHLPPLFNKEYSDAMIAMGILGQMIKDPKGLVALSRFYWATIEFSLMIDGSKTPFPEIKALGAGLMSSKEEIGLAISDKNNTQREFNVEDIIEWDYDPNGIQDRHYIINDWRQVTEGISWLFKNFT